MERLPPQSEQAEQAVLGGILIDSSSIWKVIDILKPDDFYYPKHSKIYSAVLDLVQHKQPVDILTLSDKLKSLGILDEVGGLDYLTYLINTVPSAFNIYNYAKIVVDKKIRRQLISASNEIFDQAFDESLATEELLDLVEQKIFSIVEKSSPYEFKHIKSLLEDAYERIELLQKQEKERMYRGIPTGFPDLDNLLSGLQKSDFIILASRPSLGKTTLALDIARHVGVVNKIPVGIFSLEMSSDQIVDRLLAAESGISLWRLRTGKLYTEGEINEMALLANAFDRLSESPIYIDDTPTLNVLQIRAMARRLDAEVGLGLLIIDYIQLIHSYRSYESRVQEMTDISRSLKALARELQIPVLAISQLSRAPEQRASQVPRLSDLRESGSLEQDADLVMFIHKEKGGEFQNQVQLIIAKHRNGPRGIVNLYFDSECVSFRPLEGGLEAESF